MIHFHFSLHSCSFNFKGWQAPELPKYIPDILSRSSVPNCAARTEWRRRQVLLDRFLRATAVPACRYCCSAY